MKNKKIIIAGGSGFIGQSLIKYYGKENEIVILSRQSGITHKNFPPKEWLTKDNDFYVRYVRWDGKTIDQSWSREIDGADLLINLTGKSVNCRYYRSQRQEILNSRIDSTKVLGLATRKAIDPPKVWINAASATIYKNSDNNPNDEFTGSASDWKKDNMPYNFIDHLRYKKSKLMARLLHGQDSVEYREPDQDFSVHVCKLWERAFFEEQTPFTRKIALRTAITLGRGGVIIPYLSLCKFGLGGKQGTGKQMFSWVHVEDVARMIEWVFNNETATGIYNCVAPNAVSNVSFMKTLRQITGRKFGLPAPAFFLEAGAFLIGTETELLLKSRWVLPTRAVNEGFEFKHKLLDQALNNILYSLSDK